METNTINSCFTCEKSLPVTGFFCGNCLTQFKCKDCNALLEKNAIGCTICGLPKGNTSQNTNSFRFHTTLTERTIEATFSDNVGKEIAELLKDTYSKSVEPIYIDKQIVTSNQDEVIKLKTSENESIENDSIEAEIIVEKTKETINYSNDLPTLMTIAIKNLPSSEVEWIIVYSYYTSKLGTEIFTRKDIIDKHIESNRKNDSFTKNIARETKRAVSSGYINVLNDGYFLIEKGVEKAKQIISRQSGNVQKPKSSIKKNKDEQIDQKEAKSKKSVNINKTLKILSEIDFFPKGKESLEEFYKKFEAKNDYEKNLLFVHYLQHILEVQPITVNHIYTCYDALNLRVSERLNQTLSNTRRETKWIELQNSGNIVTVKGRNKIKFWNKAE